MIDTAISNYLIKDHTDFAQNLETLLLIVAIMAYGYRNLKVLLIESRWRDFRKEIHITSTELWHRKVITSTQSSES